MTAGLLEFLDPSIRDVDGMLQSYEFINITLIRGYNSNHKAIIFQTWFSLTGMMYDQLTGGDCTIS